MPTTESLGPKFRAAMSAAPASSLSSAFSTAWFTAALAAGDDAHHQGGVGAEGGRAFAGIQDAHAAGGAGAHVDEAPAAGHAVRRSHR